jgi:hypothetical protein
MNSKEYPSIKRYHIAKVYRRDQPAMTKGRMREFYQCVCPSTREKSIILTWGNSFSNHLSFVSFSRISILQVPLIRWLLMPRSWPLRVKSLKLSKLALLQSRLDPIIDIPSTPHRWSVWVIRNYPDLSFHHLAQPPKIVGWYFRSLRCAWGQV